MKNKPAVCSGEEGGFRPLRRYKGFYKADIRGYKDGEFVKYIEVKSTKRLTCPDVNDELWIDTLNITRNEWVAAQQHRDFYSIFRVYFTRDGIHMFILKNPMQKF